VLVRGSLVAETARTTLWARTFGETGGEVARAVRSAADGGVVVAFTGRDAATGAARFGVLKTLPDRPDPTSPSGVTGGELDVGLVASQFTSEALALEATGDGGTIAVGYIDRSDGNGRDAYVLKLDERMGPRIERAFVGPGDDEARAVARIPDAQDPGRDAGYIVAGVTGSFGATGTDVWVLRLDPDLDVVWQKRYGLDGNESAAAVQATLDGGFIVAGTTETLGSGATDAWVFKLDAGGTVVWQRAYGRGPSPSDLAHAVVEVRRTPGGGYVIAGSSFQEAWVFKVAEGGDVVWANVHGQPGPAVDEARAIVETATGGFAVAGASNGFGAADARPDVLAFEIGPGGSGRFAARVLDMEASTRAVVDAPTAGVGDAGVSLGVGPPPRPVETFQGSFVEAGSPGTEVDLSDLGIAAGSGPSASFSVAPPTPVAGEVVAFDGSPSRSGAGGDDPVDGFAWDFDDDGRRDDQDGGALQSRSFAAPGIYPVRLTVFDVAGPSPFPITSASVLAGIASPDSVVRLVPVSDAGPPPPQFRLDLCVQGMGSVSTIPASTFACVSSPTFTFMACSEPCGSACNGCTQMRDANETVPLVATPGAGFQFDRWEGLGAGDTSNGATADVVMSADRSIRAVFVGQQATLTVRIENLASPGTISNIAGCVTSTTHPTFVCRGTLAAAVCGPGTTPPCMLAVNQGSAVILVPNPNGAELFVFDHWEGLTDPSDADNGAAGCLVNMSGNRTVTAVFRVQ